MRKNLIYLSFLLISFSSCEEYYTPDIDTVDRHLVVEAQITNDPAKNFVHLTQSRNFNDNIPLPDISGAAVDLIENQSKVMRSTELGTGYYVFNSVPISGNKYFLRIKIQNDTYESEEVTMPPLPTISNFYTEDVVKKIYLNHVGGIPQTVNRRGKEIYADIPVANSLSHYRFDVQSILEWTWDSIPTSFSTIPTAYGWYLFNQKEIFNIAGPQSFSQVETIKKHPLLMISYNPLDYLYTDSLAYHAWILIIEQYGTSKESFEYHESLNRQFAAAGSLFDPIQNQVSGNIICKNNPLKTAFGYFDLNSYQQYRYYFDPVIPPGNDVLRQIFRFPALPSGNGIIRTHPKKNPPGEILPPVPPPVWWE